MSDVILGGVIAVIVVLAGRYLYKAHKSGVKCVGCPSAKVCSKSCSGCNCKK